MSFIDMIKNFFARFFKKKPVPVPTPAPVPAPTPTPAPQPFNSKVTAADANGLVGLVGIPTTWDGWRFQISEVTLSQKNDAGGRASANLTHANGEYNIVNYFIGACYETVPNGPDFKFADPVVTIPKTISYPNAFSPDGSCNLGAVDGAIAWAIKLGKPPGPNAGATPFPHP